MKLSTILKVEAFTKATAQVAALGATTLLQSRVRKFQNETSNTLNAQLDVAVANSYAGQKFNGAVTIAGDKYENIRSRFITPEKEDIQPKMPEHV